MLPGKDDRYGARPSRPRPLIGAAVALAVGAAVARTATAQPCPTDAPVATGAAEDGSWLQQQIRHFSAFPHLDRAYRLIKEGKAQEATDELAGYLQRNPHDAAARQSYLILLYEQGRYAETVCEATSLLKNEPPSGSVLVYRAMAEQRLGQSTAALMDFRDAAASESAARAERVFAANSELELLIRDGRFAEAQAVLEGIAREADDFAFYYRKGLVADGLGRDLDAESAYQTAIDKAVKPTDRATALAAAGRVAVRRRRWVAARGWLRAAHEIEPENNDFRRELAEVDAHLRKYDEAAKLIDAVLAVTPSMRDREALAELSVRRQKWADAAAQYTALLTEPTGSQERYRLMLSLAGVYQKLGRHLDAEATLRNAVSIKQTPEALGALAVQLDMNGKTQEAAQLLKTSLSLKPSARVHTQLSVVYEKLGDRSLAIRHVKDALRMADRRELHKRLAYLYAEEGSYAAAAREFERAIPRAHAALWHIRTAELYAKAGDRSKELEQLGLAAAAPLSPASRRHVEQRRGVLYSQLGDTERSIEAWRGAVAAGLDDSAIHSNLAFALLKLQRWDEARAEFLKSNEREASPSTLYYIAHCYRKLGQPAIAVSYLELAERDAQRLDTNTLKALYDELGFGYSEDGKDHEATAAWRKSLGIRYDAPTALELAAAERRLGNVDEAEKLAPAIPVADLTVAQRVARAELIAEIREGKRQFTRARAALWEADELEPTAERAYRMGLLAQRAADDRQAVKDYERAVARDADNLLYMESLGNAYRRTGRTRLAEELFKRVVARNPDRPVAYRELAYTQIELGRQSEAAKTLRQAIDAQLAASSSEHDSTELPAMRTEYESLARRFSTTFYESYRPKGGPAVGGTLNGGVIQSQGGAEWSYFPAGAFGRSDGALQFGARLLWSPAASGLGIDHASTQGGLSLRYKPLTQANLFVGAERLVKIGANSESDWLLRSSFGLGNEVERRLGKTHWNYWQFYADAGYFVGSRTEATYLEFRRGITLPATANLLITPHVVLSYRQQNPDPTRTTISEGGPGVSFKYLFGGSRYEPHGPTFDALFQYRARLSGQGHGDWVLTGVARF